MSHNKEIIIIQARPHPLQKKRTTISELRIIKSLFIKSIYRKRQILDNITNM